MCESDNIDQWKIDCREQFAVNHENEVFLKFVLLARQLGYRHASLAVEIPSSVIEPVVALWASYADDWVEKFVERHVRHHGARMGYGKRKSAPAPGCHQYHWSRCDFWREARAYEIEFEVEEAIPGRRGTSALVGLASHAGVKSALHHSMLNFLIGCAIGAMTPLLLDKYLPQHRATITEIERRYMCLVLDGYPNPDIAEVLGIPVKDASTIQRNLPKRFDKLGIVPASFLAYKLGLLEAPVL